MAGQENKRARIAAQDAPTDGSSSTPESGTDHIKRPCNPFMCFRQAHCKAFQGMAAWEVSARLGRAWRAMSAEEKLPWEQMAEMASLLHRAKHPGYKYRPKRGRKRGTKCRQPRSTPKTTGEASSATPAVQDLDADGGNDEEYVQPKASTSGLKRKRETLSPAMAAMTFTFSVFPDSPPPAALRGNVASNSPTTKPVMESEVTDHLVDAKEGSAAAPLSQSSNLPSSSRPGIAMPGPYVPFTFQFPSPPRPPESELLENIRPEVAPEEPKVALEEPKVAPEESKVAPEESKVTPEEPPVHYPILALDDQHLSNGSMSQSTGSGATHHSYPSQNYASYPTADFSSDNDQFDLGSFDSFPFIDFEYPGLKSTYDPFVFYDPNSPGLDWLLGPTVDPAFGEAGSSSHNTRQSPPYDNGNMGGPSK
ncbi:hypothetical protein L218DRAFT_713761 [Marasmius fiardii PR-910]|nr:hypothetical protein L218DRAFT_713761 [Marasmius fiardii PR-910]